jgi:hypothetical protein
VLHYACAICVASRYLRVSGTNTLSKEGLNIMRNREEIVARLTTVQSELDEVNAAIQRLVPVVQRGDAGWLQALEVLAAAYQRRNALRVQAENLQWVLTPMTQLAS